MSCLSSRLVVRVVAASVESKWVWPMKKTHFVTDVDPCGAMTVASRAN